MARLIQKHNDNEYYTIVGDETRFNDIPDALKVADMIVTHSDIDKQLTRLILAFARCESKDIIKLIENNHGLHFEGKRRILLSILEIYPEDEAMDKDGSCMKILHQNGQKLSNFLKDIQKLAQYRNNSAHSDVLEYILRKTFRKELEMEDPDLLEDENFCRLTGVMDTNKIIDLNDDYRKYNQIIDKYVFLIDMLEQGLAWDIAKEIVNNE